MWQRKLEFQTWYYISNPKKKQRLSKKIRLYPQSLATIVGTMLQVFRKERKPFSSIFV